MSVKNAKHYLMLLTEKDASEEQKRCLLATANEQQLNGLSEVLYNIDIEDSTSRIKLNKKVKSKVKKNITVLHGIINTKKGYKNRLSIIRENLKELYAIINPLSPQISKIVKSITDV